MKIDITDLPDEQEGLCYDLERARSEGLHEEWRLTFVTGHYGDPMDTSLVERPLSLVELEALETLVPDASVNLPPGEVVDLHLILKYRYGYGRAE